MTPAHHDYLPDVLADRRRRFLCETALIRLAVFAVLAALCGLMTGICPGILSAVFFGFGLIASWQAGGCFYDYLRLRKAPRP